MRKLFGVLKSDSAQLVERNAKEEIASRFYPGQFRVETTVNARGRVRCTITQIEPVQTDTPALDLCFNAETGVLENLQVCGVTLPVAGLSVWALQNMRQFALDQAAMEKSGGVL